MTETDPLAPNVSVRGGGAQGIQLVAAGKGQRIVVELDHDAAVSLADDLYELAEGPTLTRERSAPAGRHPGTVGLLRWFEYGHLPAHLGRVSARFHRIAHELVDELPDGAELTTALRKLLEGKDAAVRAAIELDGAAPQS